MKIADVKALTNEELAEKLAFEKDNFRKVKFAHAISPIENPMKLKETRKVIARLMTETTARSKAGK